MRYRVEVVVIRRTNKYIEARSMKEAAWQVIERQRPDEGSAVLVTRISKAPRRRNRGSKR